MARTPFQISAVKASGFLVLMALISFGNCNKPEATIFPEVRTDSIVNVLMYSVEAYGSASAVVKSGAEEGFCWGLSANPTVEDSFRIWQMQDSRIFARIKNLTPNTTYYVRCFVRIDDEYRYANAIKVTTWDGADVTDVDGNTYQCVQIGEQGWLTANLKTTHYPDGTDIFNWCPENSYAWYGHKRKLSQHPEADFDHDNDLDSADSLSYVYHYGLLYTWDAANNSYSWYCDTSAPVVTTGARDVCPTGWHVPSDSEWQDLENYVLKINDRNYDSIAPYLKSKTGWVAGKNGIDKFGFRALPSGYRNERDSTSENLGVAAYFWSSTVGNEVNGDYKRITSTFSGGLIGKAHALPVRCIKDR